MRIQRSNSHVALLHGNYQPRMLDLARDVMAARVVGIRQEGVKPCRMVPSMRDEVHVQLHDVTGKVQRGNSHIAHLCTATISRACWTSPMTSCSCTCTSSLMDGTIRQGAPGIVTFSIGEINAPIIMARKLPVNWVILILMPHVHSIASCSGIL